MPKASAKWGTLAEPNGGPLGSPAEGCYRRGRYFSNIRGGQRHQSSILSPSNRQQVAAYKQALEGVFDKYADLPC
jgi:hypothetical protein